MDHTDRELLVRIDERQQAMCSDISEMKEHLKAQNGRIGGTEKRQGDLETSVSQKHSYFKGWITGIGAISLLAAALTVALLLTR